MMQVNAGFTGDERRSSGDRGTHKRYPFGPEEEGSKGRRTWLTDKFFGFGFRCNWPCAEITLNYRIIRVPPRCERASKRERERGGGSSPLSRTPSPTLRWKISYFARLLGPSGVRTDACACIAYRLQKSIDNPRGAVIE